MSDHSRSLKFVAQWLTEFVFHLNWLPFMTSSISLNSRNVSKYLRRSWKHKPLRLNLIYLTPNNLSKSWIPRRESPEARKLRCIRSYGIITLKSQFPNLIVRFYSASESRDEIHFRGEGCNIQVFRILKH
jgi:hypothetical protein